MHEVRSKGHFAARFEDEAQAQKWAQVHSYLEELSIEPSRPFEVHCEDGFIDSFHSEEEAKAAMEQHSKRFKELSVKSDGETLAELSVEVEEAATASELPTDPAPPDAA